MAEIKAIEYIDDTLHLKTVSRPTCGNDEVLIKVESCLIDNEKTTGNIIGGQNFAGVVCECGTEVSDIKPGDRVAVDSAVYCGKCFACRKGEVNNCEHTVYYGKDMNGGYAQLVAVKETAVYGISDSTSFDEAVFVRRVADIYAAFSKITNKSGYSMLIVGSGIDADIANQMAKKTSAGKFTAVSDNLSFDEIKSRGGVADVVVDLSRDNKLTYRLLDLVIPGGSMLMLGKSKGEKTLDFQDARDFFFHIANIITSNPKAGYFIDGLSYIEEKQVDVSNLISNIVKYSMIGKDFKCPETDIIILHPND